MKDNVLYVLVILFQFLISDNVSVLKATNFGFHKLINVHLQAATNSITVIMMDLEFVRSIIVLLHLKLIQAMKLVFVLLLLQFSIQLTNFAIIYIVIKSSIITNLTHVLQVH